jgi:sulfur-carrier protein
MRTGILSANIPRVTVELFGIARHRAGLAELFAEGRTVGQLLQAVALTCPGLRGLMNADGTLSRQYLVSVDGERFVADPDEEFPSGSRLLILGADAGG